VRWKQVDFLWSKLVEREFGRFLAVGSANTLFAYTLYFIFNYFVHYQIAYAGACICGLLFSYWLNTHWVFKEKPNWRAFLSFPMVYVVQYLIGMVSLHFLVETFGFSEWFSPLIVIVLTIPITFILSRYVITKKKLPGVGTQ
jgi:putative flippase GtrA